MGGRFALNPKHSFNYALNIAHSYIYKYIYFIDPLFTIKWREIENVDASLRAVAPRCAPLRLVVRRCAPVGSKKKPSMGEKRKKRSCLS